MEKNEDLYKTQTSGQFTPDAPVEPPKAKVDKKNERTVVCPVCGYLNFPTAKLCEKCQSVLQRETIKMEPDEDIVVRTKLGSAQLQKNLFLHVRGSTEPIEIGLREAELIMGRYDPMTGEKPDVDLHKYDAADKGVSRRHAKLTYRNGTLKISDLQSSNHTYLNGQELVSNQNRILRDGDEIRLGGLVMSVQFGESTRES